MVKLEAFCPWRFPSSMRSLQMIEFSANHIADAFLRSHPGAGKPATRDRQDLVNECQEEHHPCGTQMAVQTKLVFGVNRVNSIPQKHSSYTYDQTESLEAFQVASIESGACTASLVLDLVPLRHELNSSQVLSETKNAKALCSEFSAAANLRP